MITVDTPWLDGKQVVFGSVTNGMEVINILVIINK